MEGVFLTPGSCWDSDITFLALISHEGSLLFEASSWHSITVGSLGNKFINCLESFPSQVTYENGWASGPYKRDTQNREP